MEIIGKWEANECFSVVLVLILGDIANGFPFQWLKKFCEGTTGQRIYYHHGYYRISCEKD